MSDFNELEDFGAIENAGKSVKGIDLSNVYSVKVGGFEKGEKLRTFISSATVSQLIEDLKLYETLTKDKSWPVSQIIQREVDRHRVAGITRTYVLGKGRLVKYFPPIIVAILPKDEDGRISQKLPFGEEINSSTPELIFQQSSFRANEKIKDYIINAKNDSFVQGMYLLRVSKVFDLNLFSWDKNSYYGIVIDGQHRLQSLIESVNLDPAVGNYLQDVVFLDVSPLLQEHLDKTPVEVVRRVFVDINTNARKVGFVRQVLMDDKDLASLCVQSLVDSAYRDGTSKNQDSYIPSQVVDWYGDKLKHQLPHLTGVLTLHQILQDYLIKVGLSTIDDMRSPKKVLSWVQRMNDVFNLDKAIEAINANSEGLKITTLNESLQDFELRRQAYQEYEDSLDDDLKETELFQFDFTALDIAADRFDQIYLKPLVKFFTKFQPYARGISIIEEKGGFGDNQVLSEALVTNRNKIAKSKIFKEPLTSLRNEMESELNKSGYLAYTVLGQKVIFGLLFARIQHSLNPQFGEERCFRVVDELLNDLNDLMTFFDSKEISLFGKDTVPITAGLSKELMDLGTISTSFWDGIIYDNNTIVYNSQGISTLSALLDKFIEASKAISEGNTYKIDLADIPWVKSRIKRILKKRFDYVDDVAKDLADKIVEAKTTFLSDYFQS